MSARLLLQRGGKVLESLLNTATVKEINPKLHLIRQQCPRSVVKGEKM